jgi:acetyl-CoA acetyltransferase family protein
MAAMASEQPVIVAAVRTPFGELHGALSAWHPADLLGALLAALGERAALEPQCVDHVIAAAAMPVGAQADIGRAAVLAAGWPDTLPTETITQHSSSSMLAVLRAAHAVRSGDAGVVVAAGVEVMSLVPMGAAAMARHAYGKPWGDRVAARYAAEGGLLPDDLRADALAREHGIDRGAQDAWAHRSHARARAGRERLAPQLVAVDGGAGPVGHDERIARDIGDLAELSPMFDDAGTVTAANRAAIGDGAAAIVVASATVAARQGWAPLCRVRAGSTGARGPRDLEPAAVAAVARVLARTKVKADRLDRVELHEGHAASVLHLIASSRLPDDCVNPDGGSIAFGHPTGATGARLVTALAHGLSTRGTVGLAIVEGEDTATAVLFER